MPIIGSSQGATRHLRRQFGDRAKVGAKGERFTRDELAKLFERHPSTWVFHGLSLPGWGLADLDHVVCRADRVVVIDSKCWSPGRYWSVGKSVYRGLQRFEAAEKVNLTRISKEIATYLGLDVTVHPLVVIWPSHPGPISTRWPGLSLRLPDDTPFCIGRDLDVTLRRILGSDELQCDETVVKRLTALTLEGKARS